MKEQFLINFHFNVLKCFIILFLFYKSNIKKSIMHLVNDSSTLVGGKNSSLASKMFVDSSVFLFMYKNSYLEYNNVFD